jgi:glycosyltransferase involved in cell wall biosynthesis
MACGKPVIATRCGGPEDIVNPQTGLLVPQQDDMALSEALHEVLSGEHRFDAQEIRRYATQNYGYERIASRILDIYRQLAQKH